MPADFVVVVPSGTHQKAAEKALIKDNMVNINGCDDQFYRYKCPQLVATCPNAHASKMVKMALVNIDDVSQSLQRPPSWLPNYIGYTWSAKAEYNKNKQPGENCFISGNYKAEVLNEVVTKFVEEWVLCPRCNNPELNMKVKKKKGGDGSIKFDCSACGYSGKQKKEIMASLPKMTAHIFNNPPSTDTGTQKIEAKQDEEERAAKEGGGGGEKKAKKKDETEEERAERKAREKEEKAARKAEKAAKKEAKKAEKEAKKAEKEAASPRAEPEPEPADAESEADSAREDRLAKMGDGSMTPREGSMTPRPGDAAPEETPAAKLAAAVEAEASADDLAALFATQSEGLDKTAAVSLLFTALCSSGWKPAFKMLKTHKKLIAATVSDEAAQTCVLGWMTEYVGAKIAADDSGKEGKALAKLLHSMYELDQLEEDVRAPFLPVLFPPSSCLCLCDGCRPLPPLLPFFVPLSLR